VFLSYASQDAEAAQRISNALRAAGIEVFLDQSELRGGDAWDQKIRQQIHDCALFIPVISQHTQERLEGYFRHEWNLAIERGHHMARQKAFLMPVVVDGTGDREALVPDEFRAVQWTRLSAGDATPAFVERVQGLLRSDPAHQAATELTAIGRQDLESTPASKRGRQVLAWLVLAALLLGTGYLVVRTGVATKPFAATAIASDDKSVAVLPFVDMSEKHDQEYFSDGLTEELIDHLARVPDLKVIARTSAFQFKGKNEDMRAIAQKLGVGNLLEGSVRKSGEAFRITAQLIRAADGTHLWSDTYQRPVEDIFKVQDEIAASVTHSLQVALRSGGKARADKSDAYDRVLRARYLEARGNKGDNAKAIELYQEALALDPAYALAWTELGSAYWSQASYAEATAAEASAEARAALQRSLELDPASAAAHRLLGNILFEYDWDPVAAQRELERAAALDPDGADGRGARDDMQWYAGFRTGNFEAPLLSERAKLQRDPLNEDELMTLGWAQYWAGQFESSAVTFHRVLELNPSRRGAQAALATSLLYLGQPQAALAAAEKEPLEAWRLNELACINWDLGRRTESDAALHTFVTRYAQTDPVSIADAYAYRNDKDAAFRWLEQSYRLRHPGMIQIRVDPFLRNLHGDPRFAALLEKMKLTDQQ
jgi:TolB-like protein/Tfp pilus assembly protein PilF